MAQLHFFLLPINFYGHTRPVLDMAKLLVSRGVKTTIIATPSLTRTIERIRDQGFPGITVLTVQFPEEFQGADETSKPGESMLFRYARAVPTLQEPVEKLLEEFRPDCLIADMFYPWACESAAKFHIPRLAFNGTSLFAECASDSIRRNKPFMNALSDSEPFVLPDFPHRVAFVRTQLSHNDIRGVENEFDKWLEESVKSMRNSYGIVFNSFYELEPDYVNLYRNVLGRRAWTIGPLFLCNKETDDVQRKKKSSDDDRDDGYYLEWLDSKKPNSVVYVCFGSVARFSGPQLQEITWGLEVSGREFIWVVNRSSPDDEKWLPDGFEERTKGKGVIIRGWAPQRMILSHVSVGGFVTHCGWNSILEGVCAGVPMVTWPLFADQFHNEKLVTDVLRVGVSVGNKKFWDVGMSDFEIVTRDAIVGSLERVMDGEETTEIRGRVADLKEMAGKAVEPGGSSHSGLSSLFEELRAYRSSSLKN